METFLPLAGKLRGVEEMAVLGTLLGRVGAISPSKLSIEDASKRVRDKDISPGVSLVLDHAKVSFCAHFLLSLLKKNMYFSF